MFPPFWKISWEKGTFSMFKIRSWYSQDIKYIYRSMPEKYSWTMYKLYTLLKIRFSNPRPAITGVLSLRPIARGSVLLFQQINPTGGWICLARRLLPAPRGIFGERRWEALRIVNLSRPPTINDGVATGRPVCGSDVCSGFGKLLGRSGGSKSRRRRFDTWRRHFSNSWRRRFDTWPRDFSKSFVPGLDAAAIWAPIDTVSL